MEAEAKMLVAIATSGPCQRLVHAVLWRPLGAERV